MEKMLYLSKSSSFGKTVSAVKSGINRNPSFTASVAWIKKLLELLTSFYKDRVLNMEEKIKAVEDVMISNRLALDRILHLQITDDLERNTMMLAEAHRIAEESLGDLERFRGKKISHHG